MAKDLNKQTFEQTLHHNLQRLTTHQQDALLIAHGATGSGKTYSLFAGLAEQKHAVELGLLPRASRRLFAAAAADTRCRIEISAVEVHNENVRDLLDVEAPTLRIFEELPTGVQATASELAGDVYDESTEAMAAKGRGAGMPCLRGPRLSLPGLRGAALHSCTPRWPTNAGK